MADDVEDEGDTAIFLTAEQRMALLESANQPAGEFLRGLELTGARPKELAATTAGDFDGQSLRLAHRKGRPPKLRVRHVVRGPEGIGFFTAQARGKLPAAYLFTEDGVQLADKTGLSRDILAKLKGVARLVGLSGVGKRSYTRRHEYSTS